jgi:hypothetical protein
MLCHYFSFPKNLLFDAYLLLLLQDGSLLAATINGFPLSTAKITEKRKIIEEIALADVKKVRRSFHIKQSTIQNDDILF